MNNYLLSKNDKIEILNYRINQLNRVLNLLNESLEFSKLLPEEESFVVAICENSIKNNRSQYEALNRELNAL